MQPESSQTKKIVISLVLLALIVFTGWFFFFRNGAEEIIFDEFGNPIVAQVVGQDLIDLLAELQSVTLDASVLQSAGFLNLTDYAIDLGTQPTGRKNPFEKISGGKAQ